jgi:uncharacterized iron-regulated protein
MRRLLAALLLAAPPALAAPIAPEALDALPAADVVILGEVHDNAEHHRNQARAVRAIRPAALVFEMLTPDQAAAAAGVPRDDAAALAAALGWDGSGWPDFALYHPIFAAAPQAGVFGGGAPLAQVRRAIAEGAAAAFGAEAARFGLDLALAPDDQAAREAVQMAAHCDALPAEMLPGMVAAQRLRDATLAAATLAAHEATGGPVVVITGSGHARRDEGVPAKLALAAPALRVLSVGQVEAGEGEGDTGELPFDLWLVTPPIAREDPCAVFRR